MFNFDTVYLAQFHRILTTLASKSKLGYSLFKMGGKGYKIKQKNFVPLLIKQLYFVRTPGTKLHSYFTAHADVNRKYQNPLAYHVH